MNSTGSMHLVIAHELPILSVTLYDDRADIERELSVDLKMGRNEILVRNISQCTINESVRVDGCDTVNIQDVCVEDVPALPDESDQHATARNDLKMLENKKKEMEDQYAALQSNVSALENILKKVDRFVFEDVKNGEGTLASFQESSFKKLNEFFEHYCKFYGKFQTKMRQILEDKSEIEKEIQILQEKIDTGSCNRVLYSKNVKMILECAENTTAKFVISYQVNNAGWYPTYDIRLRSSENNVLQVSYRAKIHQSCGEDWNDTFLKLSTAKPSFGGNLPELGTLCVSIREPIPDHQPLKYSVQRCSVPMQRSCAFDTRANATGSANDVQAMNVYDQVLLTQSVLSAVFNIPTRKTIKSGTNEHKIRIATIDFDSTIMYEAIPCKSSSVYLVAYAMNKSSYPLLAGNAAIYLNNNFVSRTNLVLVSPGEHFRCCLGVDQDIKINYKAASKVSGQSAKIFSKSSTIHLEQKILIKNSKKEKIKILIREHIPKSIDEKIKMKLVEPELELSTRAKNEIQPQNVPPPVGSRLDENHNLEWVMEINEMSEESLFVVWSLEYPSSDRIQYRENF